MNCNLSNTIQLYMGCQLAIPNQHTLEKWHKHAMCSLIILIKFMIYLFLNPCQHIKNYIHLNSTKGLELKL